MDSTASYKIRTRQFVSYLIYGFNGPKYTCPRISDSSTQCVPSSKWRWADFEECFARFSLTSGNKARSPLSNKKTTSYAILYWVANEILRNGLMQSLQTGVVYVIPFIDRHCSLLLVSMAHMNTMLCANWENFPNWQWTSGMQTTIPTNDVRTCKVLFCKWTRTSMADCHCPDFSLAH